MAKAIYPGSFDPITLGHLDIIKRSSKLFDELVIGVLNNSAKNPLFSISARVNIIKELTKDLPNVTVVTFDGLLVDFAKSIDATVVVRGLRAVTDYEYEVQIAQANKAQFPQLETLFLTADLRYTHISSSIVKEFASYGGDITQFVPEEIVPLIQDKYNKRG